MLGDLLGRCTFPPQGTSVSCALSGGADSTALVILAVAAGCRVEAIHVDHRLRPDSADDALLAAATAAQAGVPFRCHVVEVEPGANLESRARRARYLALPDDVLTGHTADDQAETVLLQLMRGAGLDGLAAMAPGPTRPLLRLRRAETVALCAAEGYEVAHDPTNCDPAFLRNRVRHELLGLLEDISGRDPVPVLARQADLLRDERDLLDELAQDLDPTDAKALARAPAALARRALRRWLRHHGYPPDGAAIERVLAVARGDALACELAGGRRVERHLQRLSIVDRHSGPRSG